jgi:hypothetical protein
MYGTFTFATQTYGNINKQSVFERRIDRFINNTFSPLNPVEENSGESRANLFFNSRAFETGAKIGIINPVNLPVTPCECE